MIKIDFETKEEVIPEYIVLETGVKCLYDKNHQFHSYNDLPAIIWKDGTKWWFKHGKFHRDNNLPAIVFCGGRIEYWENGTLIRSEYDNYRFQY